MKKIINSIQFNSIQFNSIFIILLLSISSFRLYAQKICRSDVNIEDIRLNSPAIYLNILDFNRQVQAYKNALPLRMAEDVVIIPIVVHILHNTQFPEQNISDARVHSQIAVLNEDFNRLNTDASNTPSAFAGVASNPKFRFRLACIDPFGSPTTGIIRKQTRVISYNPETSPSQVQSSMNVGGDEPQFVGDDPWPTNKYLNIWVCNNSPEASYGYIYDKGATNMFIDGIVIHYEVFGRSDNQPPGNKLGRTGTHEVGHWLNCWHIFEGNSCTGVGDNCNDTPQQNGLNRNCPTFPKPSCTGQPNGDMFMNFMDYTNDECQNLFTVDQKNRMRTLFEPGGFRRSIIENNNALNQVTRNFVPQNGSNIVMLKKTSEGSNDIGSTSFTYTPIYVDDCKKTGDISWRLVHRNSWADVIISGESASVRLTRSNATCELEVTIPTSTGNIIENYSFYVYVPLPHYDLSPNPTSDVFRIEQRNNPNDVQLLETDYDVTIYNTANTPVKKGKGNKGKATFDLSNQPRGLYQVIIETQGRLVSKRVMVQR
jgi:hypothetical protein